MGTARTTIKAHNQPQEHICLYSLNMSASKSISVHCALHTQGSLRNNAPSPPCKRGLLFAPSLEAKFRSHAPPLTNRISGASRRSQVRMSAEAENKPEVVKAAENMGFDLSEGIFGFTPFSELWVGRLAMSGFAIGLGNEFATGKGILMQLGLCDGSPNYAVFAVLMAALVASVGTSTTKTLFDVQNGSMNASQLKRYAQFFGINDKAVEDASKRLKKFGDFTSPDNVRDIDNARANMPADRVLAIDSLEASTSAAADMKGGNGPFSQLGVVEIDAAAANMKAVDTPSTVTKGIWQTDSAGLTAIDELAYAKDVEMRNGRWAMVGFATAILVEAGTGMGILPQLIFYFKLIGLLGPDSGF